MWNVDETGIALWVCVNQRVIGTSKTTHAYLQTPENREWVSITECVSATGLKIDPVVIFKGKTLQSTWFTAGETPTYHYTVSEKGWISNDIGIRWLRDVFLPTTAPIQALQTPRLLLLDGHDSHVSVEFMRYCFLCMPP
jgi:DDE superfamily endonuclease